MAYKKIIWKHFWQHIVFQCFKMHDWYFLWKLNCDKIFQSIVTVCEYSALQRSVYKSQYVVAIFGHPAERIAHFVWNGYFKIDGVSTEEIYHMFL